jgi:hypothetical protein
MEGVGWLEVDGDGIHVPHFERYLSEGAKKRALASSRQAKHKAKRTRKSNASSVTPSVTSALPEKRREECKEKKTKKEVVLIPEKLQTERFQGAWDNWLAFRRQEGYSVKSIALKAQLTKLEGFGEAVAIQAI